jgi:polyhydroxybutyrate depolymerase
MNAGYRLYLGRNPRLALAAALAIAACAGPHGHTQAPMSTTSASRQSATSRPAPSVTQATRSTEAAAGATVVATLTSFGVERTYRLRVPPRYHTAQRAPLVLVLHGASGNAGRVELRYHWDAFSDRDGFFVVYPQGVFDRWNATLDPGRVDDVAFLGALIDHLARTFPIDSRRVYVAGMSNGGAMTYRIGCALSNRIAAIAPVEAWNPGCRPARPVSMVAVHGLADRQVSFAGAQQSVSEWAAHDGCPLDPRVQRNGPITNSAWAPCAVGTTVELFAVAGSGHEWPGSSPPLAGHDLPSHDLDATATIWHFFQQHGL